MPMIPLPQPEHSKWKSLALAAAVHLLLIGALFLGVQWKSQPPSSVEVEVWRAAPAPVVKLEPKPERKPELKPEPKPLPKPEVKPLAKPDIVVKEEKKPKELPKKEEPKKPEPKKEEPKREVPDLQKELARELKEADQRKSVDRERARAVAESSQRDQLKAEQVSAARKRGLDNYAAKIRGAIRSNISIAGLNIQGNPESVFEVIQLPTGDVLDVKIRKSSGSPGLDAAIERAIRKSSPLPKPDQPELFERVLRIPYKPLDE